MPETVQIDRLKQLKEFIEKTKRYYIEKMEDV